MPDFRQRSPGEMPGLSAAEINAWNASAKAHGKNPHGLPPGRALPFDLTQQLLVLVRNDTGSDLDPFAVLAVAVTDPVPDVPTEPHSARQLVMLPGGTPALDTDPVVVTVEPIADGEIGRAVTVGAVPCKVLKAATGDTFATPIIGDNTRMAGGAAGPYRILWSESGTGEKWAVVLLGGCGTPATGGTWIARLAAVSGGYWSWQRWGAAPGTSTMQAYGFAGSFTAVPSKLDMTYFANPAPDLFVVMWESTEAPGYQEFLPIGYANGSAPGLVSMAAQTMGDGIKTFQRGVVVNSTATGGAVFTVHSDDLSNPLIVAEATGHGVTIFTAAQVGELDVFGDVFVALCGTFSVTGDPGGGFVVTFDADSLGGFKANVSLSGGGTGAVLFAETVGLGTYGALFVANAHGVAATRYFSSPDYSDLTATGMLTWDNGNLWWVFSTADGGDAAIAFGEAWLTAPTTSGRMTVGGPGGGSVLDAPGGFAVNGVDGKSASFTVGGVTYTFTKGILTNVV